MQREGLWGALAPHSLFGKKKKKLNNKKIKEPKIGPPPNSKICCMVPV